MNKLEGEEAAFLPKLFDVLGKCLAGSPASRHSPVAHWTLRLDVDFRCVAGSELSPDLMFDFDGRLEKMLNGFSRPIAVVATCDLPPPKRALTSTSSPRHASLHCGMTVVMRRWMTGCTSSRIGIWQHNRPPITRLISASIGDWSKRRF